MGLFKRGYEAAREEKQRQDQIKEDLGKKLWRFILKEDEEATVRFLTEEPINFNEHTIKSIVNGKESYINHICTGDNCPYCANDDRPSFKGAYLIIDKRPTEYTDKKTSQKKKIPQQVRLYVQGTRVISQLDRLSSRYGLTDRDYNISRTGKGTSTSYIIDRTDDIRKLTTEEIKNALPEKLREDYNGTMESLYAIVQEQLEMDLPDYVKTSEPTQVEDGSFVSIDDIGEQPSVDEKPKSVKKLFRKK